MIGPSANEDQSHHFSVAIIGSSWSSRSRPQIGRAKGEATFMADTGPVPSPQPVSPVITAGGILLAIAGLYLGREFFIPFTLAILLAFALSPIVNALRRWRVP